MEGDFSFPVKYGYSLTGQAGSLYYHLMHPHQDICYGAGDTSYCASSFYSTYEGYTGE